MKITDNRQVKLIDAGDIPVGTYFYGRLTHKDNPGNVMICGQLFLRVNASIVSVTDSRNTWILTNIAVVDYEPVEVEILVTSKQ